MLRKTLNIVSGLADQARRKGPVFAVQAAAWRLHVALEKAWIAFQDRHSLHAYRAWTRRVEAPRAPAAGMQLASSPRFTILVYAPQASDPLLMRTIESITGQNYFFWEARLVCDRQDECGPSGWPVGSDFRYLPYNVDECTGWAEAVQAARGVYVLAIPAGATLAPQALQEMALRLGSDPAIDILYSDEDRLSDDGSRRHSPFFKPGWSPELFLSVNYLLNAAFRRSLLLKMLQGAETGYPGVVYRAVRQSGKIAHIPRVLVHNPVGATLGSEAPEEQAAWLAEHLSALGLADVQVTDLSQGGLRAAWKAPARLVSIIIPTRDQVESLRRCIDSLHDIPAGLPFEIILVDSGSREPATHVYYESLRGRDGVRIIEYPGAFNFSAALNLGARHAGGDLLLFLNNDTCALHPGWLEELACWALLPGVGISGALLLYPDGAIQHAGIVVGMEGHASHIYAGSPQAVTGPFVPPLAPRNVSAVTGACMLMRRTIYDELGGFDEAYALVFSDVEICLRAWEHGYRVVYTPYARLEHYEGRTRYRSMPYADLERGAGRFLPFIRQGDPYYNPNLSLAVRTPTLRRGWETGAVERLEQILRYSSGESHT